MVLKTEKTQLIYWRLPAFFPLLFSILGESVLKISIINNDGLTELEGLTTVMSMRKTAIVGVLVLITVIVYFFAAGNFDPANSSNPSKNDSESINSVNNGLTDSGDSPLPVRIPIPVDFSVNGSASHIVFAVNVDLNDGMTREEAVLVAQQLFPQVHSNATYELKSAEVNPEGVWTVSLPWGAVYPDDSQESHGHFFDATIDPETRTVEYSTCY